MAMDQIYNIDPKDSSFFRYTIGEKPFFRVEK